MSSSLPSPNNDYAAPAGMQLSRAAWDAALVSIGQRLRAMEAISADFEELIQVGTSQALAVIATNVEPQLVAVDAAVARLTADVAAAEDVIQAILIGSIPASVVTETAVRIWLTPAMRDAWNAQIGTERLADKAVTNEKLRDRPALSVLGRSSNSEGAAADIVAAEDDRLLARVGGAVQFFQLTAGMIPDGGIPFAKLLGTDKVARLGVEDQVVTGGARITPKDLGALSGNVITIDPGDRPIQKVTNNGAGDLRPGTNPGAYSLVIVNAAGAGAIATTGWVIKGDSFDTTSTSKFLCSCIVTADIALMFVTKVA